MSPLPIVVVCHEATRTGAVRVIVDLLTAAKPSLPAPLAIRLLAHGSMTDELSALADVPHAGAVPAAILVNSALAAAVLLEYGPDVPSLVYVHEAGAGLAAVPDPARRGLLAADKVLTVSPESARQLVALGVEGPRIAVLPPLVTPMSPSESGAAVRADFGLGPDDRLVVGCGEASWRKGTDLFLDVGRRLGHRDDIALVWVGRRTRGFAKMLDHDEALLGVAGRVTWTGEVADARPYLAAADTLLLTSRDDPQPLVRLEAALAGSPTVAFDFGGARPADADDHGVPYPDTLGLAAAVERMLDDTAAATTTVAAARRDAADHLAAAVVPTFVAAIAETLTTANVDAQG